MQDQLAGQGFSGTKAAKIVGISYRQLDYWARTDLVRPSLTDAKGSGSRRALHVPGPARAAGDQEPARRRDQARVGAHRVRVPAQARRHRHRIRAPRHQRRRRDPVRRRRPHRRDAPRRPGRAQRARARRGEGRPRPAARRRAPRRIRPASPSDAEQPARRGAPRPRGEDGAVRRLGHAARVPDGHDRRAPRLPA